MNRADKERQDRRQRMLAREQGRAWEPGDTLPGTDTGAGVRVPKKVRRAEAEPVKPPAPAKGSNLKPLTPLLRRRRRRRHLMLAALVLAGSIVLLIASGAAAAAAGMLRDVADNIVFYLDRSGAGWPADTGIAAPLRAEPLAGGFVVMDSEDVAVYSPYGGRVNSIQPGYGRPALAVGNTRYVLYNRAGSELRVESRTKTLGTLTRESGILLCAVSGNGTLAVLTQSERYAAVLEVLEPDLQHGRITYSLAPEDGVPVTMAFAADNRRLAAGAIAAVNGAMQSYVYCLNTDEESLGTKYAADAGSLVLRVEWLSGQRILAVFDDYAAVLAPDGSELGRYDYGGAVLQAVSASGRQAALLLSIRGGNTLVTLDEGMTVLASIPAGQANGVTATADAVYLLDTDAVTCFGYDGNQRWRQSFDAPPQAVLDARQPLVLAGGVAQPLG